METTENTKLAELLRQVGFESRTLLNGITGPIQLLRSTTNDPGLIEILHILDLSTVRFEKFSFRSQLLSDLLNPTVKLNIETCDLTDMFKHAVLELNDFINFYGVSVGFDANWQSVIVDGNKDFVYQSILIILEQLMAVLETGSTINVNIDSNRILVSAGENGFLADKFLNPDDYWSSDIDILLLEKTFDVFKIQFSVQKVEKHTVFSLGK